MEERGDVVNRLCTSTLSTARAIQPAYDPARTTIGVVHFGPGAFHRAHQAAYFDRLLAKDPRWGICGVSLHSTSVRDALSAQDGLYTLAILDDQIAFQVIASMREILFGPEDIEAVLERMSRPSVTLVTSTVTEKGYCLDSKWNLDFNHPEIVHDLANPSAPRSFIGYIVAGLKRRKSAGLAPFVLISCDNLPKNGERLKAAVQAFAAILDPVLSRWIEAELQCPCTMVDSITPATDGPLRQRVRDVVGVEDRWPIQREAFAQWVIETHTHPDGPDWTSAGVTLTYDIPAFERAKLRLLNGPHSTLAYLGLHRGYKTVSEAMLDPDLAALVRNIMVKDVAPLLEAPAGMDLLAYCEAILKRFQNPAIRHLLSQIAWDGSQKLPIRILSSVAEALERRMDVSRLCIPVAAWMRFVRAMSVKGKPIQDPLAEALRELGGLMRDDASDVDLFLDQLKIFDPALIENPVFVEALRVGYQGLLRAEAVSVTNGFPDVPKLPARSFV